MTPERWGRIKDLFSAALDLEQEAADGFLEHECADDPNLLSDVRDLIREHRCLDNGQPPGDERIPRQPPSEKLSREGDLNRTISQRFSILERAGGGAFGDVYKVLPHGALQPVALKILRDPSPGALLHFKREFRSLAQFQHPNLVSLYEFFAIENRWMFTMEFISGPNFLDFVRAGTAVPYSEREARVRLLLPQLAGALSALHGRGLLHRDLKPANVLIDPPHRLVLLDFGLVRPVEDAQAGDLTLAGTPDYMSPEQAAGQPFSEASDWYAAGVMLYQALTGALPFKGAFLEVLRRKQAETPPEPTSLCPEISPDLDVLCRGLLSLDPHERIRHANSLHVTADRRSVVAPGAVRAPLFVGRSRELELVQQAAAQTRTGAPAVVHIAGPSGIGKSLLLRQIASTFTSSSHALVLAGRCHERESVPYPGVDELVDALVYRLRHLSQGEVEQLLPRAFPLAVRMFPVLGNVKAGVAGAPIPPDWSEFRSRAFAAVREMLGRIAERRSLVLIIDDLQWGDLDTSGFLSMLTESADAPPLLLLLSYRSEDIASLPWLGELRARHEKPRGALRSWFVGLGPLTPQQTEELALRLAEPGEAWPGELLRAVVEQSAGDPFLVHEMARAMRHDSLRGLAASQRFPLEQALEERFSSLDPEERHLLELVGIAGGPVEAPVLAKIFGDGLAPLRKKLVAARLLRSRMVQGNDQLEVYHDRIRSAVVQALDAARLRSLHADLAMALESMTHSDPEALALHHLGAGNNESGAIYADQAAKRAARALAFHKAAEFYRLAIRHAGNPSQKLEWNRCLGEVLSSAGRGAEAAQAYLASAALAAGRDRLRLLSLAAGQLIRCGEVQRGTMILDGVLEEAGLSVPRVVHVRLLRFFLLRVRLRLRGLGFRQRATEEIDPEQLLRLDLCGAAALTLALADPIRSALFCSRYLLMALQAGEPMRIALALAGAATYLGVFSLRTAGESTHKFLSRAAALASLSGDARATAFVRLMRGLVGYLDGDWDTTFVECDAAAVMFRENCTGVAWELTTALMFSLFGLANRGDLDEMRRRIPVMERDAQTRGDIAQWLPRIRACAHLVQIADGEPREALRLLAASAGAWENDAYNIQTCISLLSAIDVYLYLGQPEEAWARLQREWPGLKRARLLYLPTTLALIRCARGRLALAMAASGRQPEQCLALARRDARVVEMVGPRWSRGFVHLLRAGLATFGGRPASVAAELRAAHSRLEQAGLRTFRMAVLYRTMQIDPAASSAAAAEIREWAHRQGIREPDRIAAMLLPGRWESAATN